MKVFSSGKKGHIVKEFPDNSSDEDENSMCSGQSHNSVSSVCEGE
jgi:hypothetical protein